MTAPTTGKPEHPRVKRARVAKAIKIEHYIRTRMPTARLEDLRRASPAVRARIALRAEVRSPSNKTWALVCLLLANEQLPEEYR